VEAEVVWDGINIIIIIDGILAPWPVDVYKSDGMSFALWLSLVLDLVVGGKRVRVDIGS